MSYTKNILFALFVLLLLSSLTFYGLWISQADIKDEVVELILMILISLLFLISLYWYIYYKRFTYFAVGIFVCYVILTTIVLIKGSDEGDGLNRNLALGLGLVSILPAAVISFIGYMFPEKLPVNLE